MFNFKAPIPGESLTREMGNYPWEQPPTFNTVEEGVDYYIKLLSEEEVQDDLMVMIDMGVPIDIIADSITTGGTMNGKHTLDVAYLLNPVIESYIKAQADVIGMTYISSLKEIENGTRAKKEKEKKRLAALLSSELKGASKEQLMEDNGLTLIKKVSEELDVEQTEEKETTRIEPKDTDIEMEQSPPVKGLMRKVS